MTRVPPLATVNPFVAAPPSSRRVPRTVTPFAAPPESTVSTPPAAIVVPPSTPPAETISMPPCAAGYATRQDKLAAAADDRANGEPPGRDGLAAKGADGRADSLAARVDVLHAPEDLRAAIHAKDLLQAARKTVAGKDRVDSHGAGIDFDVPSAQKLGRNDRAA